MPIGSLPLTVYYSTAIHHADRWRDVRAALDRAVVAVRRRAAAHRPVGFGLHLSGRAALDLEVPRARAELKEWMARHDVTVCTLDGGAYGRFMGPPHKSAAYRPDWLDEERLRHADRLAMLLASLLPAGGFGTINTIGGAFRARVRSRVDDAAIADRLLRHVALLARLRERTGKTVALAVEPEPGCRLATIGETAEFFDHHLHGRAATARVAGLTGLTSDAAADAIGRHVGACIDASAAALWHEEPTTALRALELAGVSVWKVQLSTALSARYPFDRQARDALQALAADVALHQVVVRTATALRRFVDLPLALAAPPPDGLEWRVNAHLPLSLETSGSLSTTRSASEQLVCALAHGSTVRHVEVNPLTIRPEGVTNRTSDVVQIVARDLAWIDARLPHTLVRSA
jgi:hypothetical protein